jgi:hypothetical protein
MHCEMISPGVVEMKFWIVGVTAVITLMAALPL